MAERADAIANAFLEIAERHNATLSPMKVQKLVYYAHGWHLAIEGQPLIDERIEAWKWGPVIPSLYREFKEFGNDPINRRAVDVRVEPSTRQVEEFEPEVPRDRKATWSLIDRVWEVYGGYSGVQLSNMTHEEGTPWHRVASKYKDVIPFGISIPNELIQEWFIKEAA